MKIDNIMFQWEVLLFGLNLREINGQRNGPAIPVSV